MSAIDGLNARLDEARKAGQQAEQLRAAGATLEARAAAAEAAVDQLKDRLEELRSSAAANERKLEQAAEARDALQTQCYEARDRNAKLRETLAREQGVQTQLREQIEQFRVSQDALQNHLAQIVEHLAALATSHERDRSASKASFDTIARAVEEARRAGHAAAETLSKRFGQLTVDAELLGVRTEYLEELVGAQRERLEELASEAPAEEDWITGDRARRTRSRKEP
jgi:chromosome segregation ATPase